MRCVRVRGRRCQVPNSTTERRRGFRWFDRSRGPLSLSAVLLCQRCRPPSLLPSFPSGWRSRLGFVRPTLHARAFPLRPDAASSLIFVFFTQKSKVGQILALPRAPCSNQPSARSRIVGLSVYSLLSRAQRPILGVPSLLPLSLSMVLIWPIYLPFFVECGQDRHACIHPLSIH